MDLDLIQLERELCRIPEVTAARVVTDRDGSLAEVHILATPTKQPKQVVRDVQSVAMAAYGVDIDRRVISVVQLEDPRAALSPASLRAGPDDDFAVSPTPRHNGSVRQRQPAGGPAHALDIEHLVTDTARQLSESSESATSPGSVEWPESPDSPDSSGEGLTVDVSTMTRILVDRVAYTGEGYRCSVEVALRLGAQRAVGVAEGSTATATVPRIVAQATLTALRYLEPAAARADVEDAAVIAVGDRRVATASVVLVVPPHEEILFGSAVVRAAGDHDALARAVLDATNRRLVRLR